MVTTLALFALFSIAECVGKATVCNGSNNGVSCKDDSIPKLVGTCTGNNTCKIDATCAADIKQGIICGTDTMKGRCKKDEAGDNFCESSSILCHGQDATGSTPCINDSGLVGKCSGSQVSLPESQTCTVADQCTQNEGDTKADCGTTYKGRCKSDKTCEVVDSVKVEYYIKANKTEEDKDQTVGKAIFADQFKSSLASTMKYTVTETKQYCPTDAVSLPLKSVGAGDATVVEGDVECSNEVGGDCFLMCPTNYSAYGHTKKCTSKGLYNDWTGAIGTCKPSCPVATSVGVFDKTTNTIVLKDSDHDVAGGVITCGVFKDVVCNLSCPGANKAVKKPTAYRCKITTDGAPGVWEIDGGNSGTKGECQTTSQVSGSAEVTLKENDNHDSIVNLQDSTFNNNFKGSVAGVLGVLAENVIITDIKGVAPGRRLKGGRRVLIEYTVLVGKGDSGAPLPTGGGLRGIS